MVELRHATVFWPEWEKCGKSDSEFSRRHGVPRETVEDWRNNLMDGMEWTDGEWRELENEQGV
jgi:hypothetical protein